MEGLSLVGSSVVHFTGLRLGRLHAKKVHSSALYCTHFYQEPAQHIKMLRKKKLTAQLVIYEKGIRWTVRWLRHFICIVWRKRGG